MNGLLSWPLLIWLSILLPPIVVVVVVVVVGVAPGNRSFCRIFVIYFLSKLSPVIQQSNNPAQQLGWRNCRQNGHVTGPTGRVVDVARCSGGSELRSIGAPGESCLPSGASVSVSAQDYHLSRSPLTAPFPEQMSHVISQNCFHARCPPRKAKSKCLFSRERDGAWGLERRWRWRLAGSRRYPRTAADYHQEIGTERRDKAKRLLLV